MTTSSIFKFWKEFFRLAYLSVSSTDFYADVYRRYKGYGLKYIAMVISITSIIYAILLFNNVTTFRYYLMNNNAENNQIEHLLKQWPEMNYNGNEITMESSEPVFLSNLEGRTVFVIDIENNLSKAQKQKIPVLFLKDKIVIQFEQAVDKEEKNNKISLDYSFFFGKAPTVLDYNILKAKLISALEPIGIITLLVVIPILIGVRLFFHVAKNMLTMVLIFIPLWYMNMRPTLEAVTRIALFTSAFAELISPVLLILLPSAVILAEFIRYFAIILALIGLFKMRSNISKLI